MNTPRRPRGRQSRPAADPASAAFDEATALRLAGVGEIFRLTLGDPRVAASAAMAFVAEILGRPPGWDRGGVDDAKTVVSELVVGALARGRNPRELVVTLDVAGGRVRLAVSADGRVPTPVHEGREQGMALVHGMSAEHGSRPAGNGRVWWAVLLLRPPEPGQGGPGGPVA